MDETKKTTLHPRHVELGALMSPFGGFDMPIQYKGITEEHNAVRNACGMFDVSHMGEVRITGPDAERFVNYIFSNDVTAAAPGQCLYGMMLNADGGVVDDLLVYKFAADNYLLVINASNIAKDERWIEDRARDYVPSRPEGSQFEVDIDFLSDSTDELAIQGPEAENVVRDVLGIDCSDLTFYTFKTAVYRGEEILISRTGYTGEDGFELYCSHALIDVIWRALLDSGRCEPCGLGCRDTLRFEVGLPLYGDELADDITPVEAGLSMFVKLDKEPFMGRDAVAAQKAAGVSRKIVGLELEGGAVPRHGYDVLDPDGNIVGSVTTGYRSISVDKSVAMALVNAEFAAAGSPLQVQIRRKRFPCKVVSKKFYKKSYKK
ncbi:MAG: glycine cleavage system aminomethyltransferase GcvT [Muribaculaceae bacterium]|nr:glycine cleavage system aminomethyltransferase GcvT [Muribaculaceae bacterium]